MGTAFGCGFSGAAAESQPAVAVSQASPAVAVPAKHGVNLETNGGSSLPAPVPSSNEAVATVAPFVTANLDPTDDEVVGPPEPIADCEERLRAEGVTFKRATLRLFRKGDSVCGAHQAVTYLKGPTGIRFEPSPVVSCPLALALARFESQVQRLSLAILKHQVTRITQGGTYNCRSMARFKLASEHSYGNAIDLYQFIFDDGSRANVLRDFGSPQKPPPNAHGEFLRQLAQTAFDEATFSVVVTRFFDELHRDHIHVDMAHYRTDGTR